MPGVTLPAVCTRRALSGIFRLFCPCATWPAFHWLALPRLPESGPKLTGTLFLSTCMPTPRALEFCASVSVLDRLVAWVASVSVMKAVRRVLASPPAQVNSMLKSLAAVTDPIPLKSANGAGAMVTSILPVDTRQVGGLGRLLTLRSGERRVGGEWRSRWSPDH